MTITTFSSREFNQSVNEAMKMASNGPVLIADHGHVTHVLISMALYQSLTGSSQKIADLLAMPDAQDLPLELPHSTDLAGAAHF